MHPFHDELRNATGDDHKQPFRDTDEQVVYSLQGDGIVMHKCFPKSRRLELEGI